MKIVFNQQINPKIQAQLSDELSKMNCKIKQWAQHVVFLDKSLPLAAQTKLSSLMPEIISFTESAWPLVASVPKNTNTIAERLIIAGPCSIESDQQMRLTAKAIAAAGATALRGGAFKPRTSPYDFQGLGEIGLKYLHEAARAHNLLAVSEALSIAEIPLLNDYVDILQIGARNMQNFPLLKALGKINKPVILKRGPWANYKEFLFAAEYILEHGNTQVILCERGIKSFETMTRNTLDLAIVPIIQAITKLPIIVDPSHAVGVNFAIPAMARAAIAAGADGLMIEVHPKPQQSISDAKQALSFAEFASIMESITAIAGA